MRVSGGWGARPWAGPYRPWLCDAGSLTARIAACCRELRVRLVRQTWLAPHGDERAVLGLRRGEGAWVREVLLLADGVPVVFAHSVLPRENARGPWRLVAGMGTRPLGAALFADPRVARTPLEFRRVDRRHALWQGAARAVGVALPPLWARRSRFCLQGRPLLVSEVFLPEIVSL